MRVLLADDHRVFLDSFRIAVTQQTPYQIVGEATTLRDVVARSQEVKHELVVLDLLFAGEDSVAAIRQLRAEDPSARILILTVHDSPMFVRDAFDAGAHGYALKDQPLAEVIEAMRLVAAGDRYLAPALGPVPPERLARPQKGTGAADPLSPREREIFRFILEGNSSREIATLLSISLKTVETHRAHINKKLGVRSPAELIRVAALRGLLPQTGALRTH